MDKDSKPIGVSIKASEFYSKPTLKFLEERFKINETKKESNKSPVKNAVRMAFYYGKIKLPEKLAEKLETEGIYAVLRKSKEGQLYGITYVDHKTQCIFNGSALGKEFSAKGIVDRCESNINKYKKDYNKSISSHDKIVQNLESKGYLKNQIDILLQAENTNDYIPKQSKKKRRRGEFEK